MRYTVQLLGEYNRQSAWKISTLKAVRNATGASLKEAKDIVDLVEERLGRLLQTDEKKLADDVVVALRQEGVGAVVHSTVETITARRLDDKHRAMVEGGHLTVVHDDHLGKFELNASAVHQLYELLNDAIGASNPLIEIVP